MRWLKCPECNYCIKDGSGAYDYLWRHVWMRHATGTGRDKTNHAAAVMQRHKVITE